MTAANHPTGIAAAAASVVVIVAKKAGVELSAEEAAVIVGAIATIVSVFTPRIRAA